MSIKEEKLVYIKTVNVQRGKTEDCINSREIIARYILTLAVNKNTPNTKRTPVIPLSSIMDSERIEFTEMSKYNSNTELSSNKPSESGCYVSAVKGFILLLLGILVAVGIGIIVHFAGSGRQVVCTCANLGSGANAPVADRITECKQWAGDGHHGICTACSKDAIVTTTTKPTDKPSTEKVDVRLPLHMEPTFYNVELQPNMYNNQPSTFNFTGSVRIVMKCLVASKNVTLQINKLDITAGTLNFGKMEGGLTVPSVIKTQEDKVKQFLIISLDKDLTVGSTYFVEMKFVGPLKDDLAGLYYTKYEYNNQTRFAATTQLAAIDARRVFPCFDEPAFKAHFNITLVRKNTMKSISNMPLLRSENRSSDMTADVFESTPKMSTYLVAFLVSDFETLKQLTSNNITFGVWTTPGKTDQSKYALETGVKILTYYEDYFNISFPLPKQDMVAVPDFPFGGMENWGLIMYRETSMLYKPGVSSDSNKQRVAVVVSHELAHQWFGNLVTPSWWDDLWLNEGFASFVEYMGVDFCHPDWKMFEQFVVEDLQDVFDFDGLTTSHPVYVPVGHPDEINEIFDRISYAKGASIIRMMRFFLGENTFRLGLTRYLNNKRYDAAFHDDLWSALTEQARVEGKQLNVKTIMDTWTLQMNYPVVTVQREGSNLRMTQTRYLSDPSATDPLKYVSPFSYKWEIPFTYTTSNNINFNQTDANVVWMNKQDKTVVNANLPPVGQSNAWIIGNVLQYGFYRVNYDEANWEALIKQLKSAHKVIPSINRAQIINDAWNLAYSGNVKMEIALKTVEYLNTEFEYVPRAAADRQFGFVQRMLSESPIYGAWKNFMLSIITTPFNTLTMNNTGASHLESYTRSLVVNTACEYGVPACIQNAKDLFKSWMDNPSVNPIDPGIKSKVYCTAVQNGGVAEWNFAFEQYKLSQVAAEKVRLLQAMACSRELWLLRRYLTKAINKDEIRKQDTLSVINYVSSHTLARSLVWNVVRENWDIIAKDFSLSLFSFSRMIGAITNSFNSQFRLKEIQEFVKNHPDLGSGERAFQQAIEKTKSNIKWMDNNFPIIQRWLTSLGFN